MLSGGTQGVEGGSGGEDGANSDGEITNIEFGGTRCCGYQGRRKGETEQTVSYEKAFGMVEDPGRYQ